MRIRYSRWDGSQDPLGPELSAGDLLERMSDDLLSGAGPDVAMSRLLRRGMSGRFSGLDALRARLRQRREQEQDRLQLEGPLEEVREALEEILETERSSLSFEDRCELYEYFRDDIALLEEMIDRDLSAWDPQVNRAGAEPANEPRGRGGVLERVRSRSRDPRIAAG